MDTNARVFSAPGKALLVGGYLVLDPRYKSYVVALSARMHAMVSTARPMDQNKTSITVCSPQFNNEKWTYNLLQGQLSVDGTNKSKNLFIECGIRNALDYFDIQNSMGFDINIDIFSDPAYHSSQGSIMKQNGMKRFNFFNSSISEVPKTGLGSSAGLVTVLTTALFSVFDPNLDLTIDITLRKIHNLSQVSHCQAQGKIGSGFDVAAATFGSIAYQRFEPNLISDLPERNLSAKDYNVSLQHLINDTDWKFTVEPVKLPDQLRLFLGDVNSGSETVKLVTKVKNWYNLNLPKSQEIYKEINAGNMAFIASLNEMNQLSLTNPEKYKVLINNLNKSNKYEDPIVLQMRESIAKIRDNFRLITRESGAEIEPPVQTELLDTCMNLNGVLVACIPGAGGYDAIALLTTEMTNLDSQTKGKEEFSNVTWLDLQQVDIGLKEEEVVAYLNLQ
ncbi:phosphomevalonate kinase NDAI_0C04150 [Naumovozyma dairenensis CBS 421]|uniref:Phosphomevalonate kinase n=1 Tax=Naumovozyma dairenensis (strain ATCC 10597 / BCRC 20456 / CBS 421 / NBRC 0211 / NRRL Y-12639) TaxID=1071378 RepID=G0W8G4_NAUDC|nr:hypothetical protein NDAI_0C04150 [Naumovozyma dairenensis CBS 421]CCD24075.1 hypothetical protein NDAI_0C04150 [Naumovozyma dairenensis CBS 421]